MKRSSVYTLFLRHESDIVFFDRFTGIFYTAKYVIDIQHKVNITGKYLDFFRVFNSGCFKKKLNTPKRVKTSPGRHRPQYASNCPQRPFNGPR